MLVFLGEESIMKFHLNKKTDEKQNRALLWTTLYLNKAVHFP